MKVEIEVPDARSKARWPANLTSRRGMIMSTDMHGNIAMIEGEVPLAETFGYSTDLRSMTQGQGTFTMEFAKYRRVPASDSGRNHRREEEAARRREVIFSDACIEFSPGPQAGVFHAPSMRIARLAARRIAPLQCGWLPTRGFSSQGTNDASIQRF